MSTVKEKELTEVVDMAMAAFEATIVANYPEAAPHLADAKNHAQKTKYEDSVRGAIRMSLWLNGQ
jgi:hypothetical protein